MGTQVNNRDIVQIVIVIQLSLILIGIVVDYPTEIYDVTGLITGYLTFAGGIIALLYKIMR